MGPYGYTETCKRVCDLIKGPVTLGRFRQCMPNVSKFSKTLAYVDVVQQSMGFLLSNFDRIHSVFVTIWTCIERFNNLYQLMISVLLAFKEALPGGPVLCAIGSFLPFAI
jgi:hypothetical protein